MKSDQSSWFQRTLNTEERIRVLLQEMGLDAIVFLLKREPTTVGSTILGFLVPEKASKVLFLLPAQKSSELIQKLAEINSTQEISLDILHEELFAFSKAEGSNSGKKSYKLSVQNIMDGLDPTTQNKILSALEFKKPELAKQLESMLFKFEDLLGLEKKKLSKVFHAQTDDDLKLILHHLPSDQLSVFKANISEKRLASLISASADCTVHPNSSFVPEHLNAAKQRCLKTAQVLGFSEKTSETYV
jgi:flagellar motor switch protein FliG